jgi:hypothetical protein
MSLYLLAKEYNWYIQYRHKFLSQRIPRNFAVYVAGIPQELRSDYALADFFQRSSWKSTVLEANVAMNISKLEAKVARREVVLQKLEHAMAEEKLKGKVKKHRTFNIKNATQFDLSHVTENVESVQAYRQELDSLNKAISLEIGMVRNSNHRLRRHLTKQESSSDVLRGRLLTPAEGELESMNADISEGYADNSVSTVTSNEIDDFKWRGSFRHPTSMLSLMDPNSSIAEEMPDDDVHFRYLNTFNYTNGNDGGEDEDNGEDIIEFEYADGIGVGYNSESEYSNKSNKQDEKKDDSSGGIAYAIAHNLYNCEVDIENLRDPRSITTVHEAPIPIQKVHDSEARPFLQVMGMGELEDVGGTGQSGLASCSDATKTTVPVSAEEKNTEEPKQEDLERTDVESGIIPAHQDVTLEQSEKHYEDASLAQENLTSPKEDAANDVPRDYCLPTETEADPMSVHPSKESELGEEETHTLNDKETQGEASQEVLGDDSHNPPDLMRRSLNVNSESLNELVADLSLSKSGSSTSVLSNGSCSNRSAGPRRLVGCSMRHLSNIRGSIRSDKVTDSVKMARDLARDLGVHGSKKLRDAGVRGSKTVRVIGAKGLKTGRESISATTKTALKAADGAKKVAEIGIKKAHRHISENAASIAPMLQTVGEGAPKTAGFVVFKDRYTTQAALQMLQHPAGKGTIVNCLY